MQGNPLLGDGRNTRFGKDGTEKNDRGRRPRINKSLLIPVLLSSQDRNVEAAAEGSGGLIEAGMSCWSRDGRASGFRSSAAL